MSEESVLKKHGLKLADTPPEPIMMFLVSRVDFDNLENRNCRIEKRIGLFTSPDLATTHIHNTKYIIYKGWDGQEYPQFVIDELPVIE